MKDKTAWLLVKKNYVLVIEKDILLEYDRKKRALGIRKTSASLATLN